MQVKNLTLHGVYWGAHAFHYPRAQRKSLEDSLQWLAEGKLKVPISHRCCHSLENSASVSLSVRQVSVAVAFLVAYGVAWSSRYSLEDAPKAFRALMLREATGKVILYPEAAKPLSRL